MNNMGAVQSDICKLPSLDLSLLPPRESMATSSFSFQHRGQPAASAQQYFLVPFSPNICSCFQVKLCCSRYQFISLFQSLACFNPWGQGFSKLHVYILISSANASAQQQAVAQRTIFYTGTMNVYNVSADKVLQPFVGRYFAVVVVFILLEDTKY